MMMRLIELIVIQIIYKKKENINKSKLRLKEDKIN